MPYKTSEKAREGNRRRNKKWAEANPEHVKKLNREKSLAHYQRNADATRAAMRERAKARWAAMSVDERRDFKLREVYKISLSEWQALLAAQGDKCAACGTSEPGGRGWQTDHCHTEGRVRGILCMWCNTGIGLAKENPDTLQAWIDYLRR